MLFNSYEFLLVFLPLVVAVYYGLPRGLRAPWLTLASYAFYGWWRAGCVSGGRWVCWAWCCQWASRSTRSRA